MRDQRDNVWRFLIDPRALFENTIAERAIRMPRLKQQATGVFLANHGAIAFRIFRSWLATK